LPCHSIFGADARNSCAVLTATTIIVSSHTPLRSDEELVSAWIERNDAQNYVLLGDPAVRIRNDVLT
jgi:hypothetical protein